MGGVQQQQKVKNKNKNNEQDVELSAEQAEELEELYRKRNVRAEQWTHMWRQHREVFEKGNEDEAEEAGLMMMELEDNRFGMKDIFEVWGDDPLQSVKSDDVLRLMSQNQDRFGKAPTDEQIASGEMVEERWNHCKTNRQKMISWKSRSIDVVLLQDTGWQDPLSVTQPELHSGGKGSEEMKRHWGGKRARVVTAQGYKVKKTWVGGVASGTVEELKPFAGRKISDARGYGRYVITELVGANGCSVAIVNWYMPTRKGGAWKMQTEMMETLESDLRVKAMKHELTEGERGLYDDLTREGATPKTILLADLAKDLVKMKVEYIIIGGDANTTPPEIDRARSSLLPSAEQIADTREMEAFCRMLGLVEPYRWLGQGKAPYDAVPETWKGRGKRGGQWSWIDYWLVSESICERGLVRGCGVLRDKQESTDHAAIYLDIDRENLLGKSRLWQDIKLIANQQRDPKLASFGVVRLSDAERLRGYRQKLAEKADCDKMDAVDWLFQQTVEGNRDDGIWRQAEELMKWWEEAAVDAQVELHEEVVPKVGGGSAARKHHYSHEYVALAGQYRQTLKIVNMWDSSVSGGIHLRMVRRAKKKLGKALPRFSKNGELPDKRSTLAQWYVWIAKLREVIGDLKGQMHGKKRKRMRERVVQRKKKLKDWVENNEQGKAYSNVQRQRRDGAVEAATVTMRDGRKRAAVCGAEVITHHYEEAKIWMGSEHKRWFYTAQGCLKGEEVAHDRGEERHILWQHGSAGADARQKLADGTYLGNEQLEGGLPECFRELVKDLQTVKVGAGKADVRAECEADSDYSSDEEQPRMVEEDYEGSGLGEVIGKADWEAFWRRAKGGTRGGASGVHADLLKACYKETTGELTQCDQTAADFGEMARKLVCIARLRRQHYASWLQELLYFFIKNPGTTGLQNSRPVGLLEVLYKCSDAFDSAAMMTVWRRKGILQPEQWAYQEGRGCEGPLLIWMMLSEEAFLNREDTAEGETDSAHAFDAPTPEAIAIAAKRFGIPQWRIESELQRKKTTYTRVITPFGLTELFQRVQGIAQGGTGSPTEWLMLIDSLAAYVKRVAPAAPGALVDEYGSKLSVWLNLLADDQGYAASGRDCDKAVEQRIEAATTWGTFFGVDTKHVKSWFSLGRWGDAVHAEGSRMVLPENHDRQVLLKDVYRGKEHKLREVGPYECNRILGQYRSLAQYPEAAVKMASDELQSTVLSVRQMPRYKWLAERLATAVGWRRLAYRLRFAYVFGSQLEKVAMPLKKALVAKLGLPPGTPLGVLGSAVVMSAGDAMLVERLSMAVKLLNTEDMRGWALRGSVQRQQQYEGCSMPVLEAGSSKCRCKKQCGGTMESCKTAVSWSGTWIGMVKQAMDAAGFTVTGGLGLPILREGDFCLVDAADDDEREMVRQGCAASEMWRCSEVMNLEGDGLHRALCRGGAVEKAAGGEWCKWVRGKFGRAGEGRGLRKRSAAHPSFGCQLGNWFKEASWSWQVVGWIDKDGERCLAKPIGRSGDKVKLQVLARCTWDEYVQTHESEEHAWQGTTMTKIWNSTRHQKGSYCWTWDGVAAEAVSVIWMAITDVLPVEVERWERKERWSPRILYRVAGWWDEQGVEWAQKAAESGVQWSKSWTSSAFNIEAGMCRELLVASEGGGWGRELKLFTDGGLDKPGTAVAQGQYGATAAFLHEGELEVVAQTGGVCDGPKTWMSAHRSELTAVIAGLAMCCVWGGWQGSIQVWLDNKAVVQGCDKMVGAMGVSDEWHAGGHLMSDKQNGYTNRESWLWKRDDRDLWEVLEGLMKLVGAGRMKFNWVKGHMDEVEGHTLTWQEKGNVAADAICNQWKGVLAAVAAKEMPRERSWRLHLHGIEVVSPLRESIEQALQEQRLREYLKDVKGWGSTADVWMDRVNTKALRMKGMTVTRRVRLVKYVYGLMMTDDVVALNWSVAGGKAAIETRKESEQFGQLARCALCGECAVDGGSWSRNWHLVSGCKDERVVQLRRELQARISLDMEEYEALQGDANWLTAPWLLDGQGAVREVGTANELEALMIEHGGERATSMADKVQALLSGGKDAEAQQWKLLYKGLTSGAWQALLVECGLGEEEAVQVRKKVQEATAEYATELSKEYMRRKYPDLEEEVSEEQKIADTPVHLRALVQRLTIEVLDSAKTVAARGRLEGEINSRSWKRKLEWAAKRTVGQVSAELKRQAGRQKRKKQVRCKLADTAAAARLRAWIDGNATDSVISVDSAVDESLMVDVEEAHESEKASWGYTEHGMAEHVGGEGEPILSIERATEAAAGEDSEADEEEGSRWEMEAEHRASRFGQRRQKRRRCICSDDEDAETGEGQVRERLAVEGGRRYAEEGGDKRRCSENKQRPVEGDQNADRLEKRDRCEVAYVGGSEEQGDGSSSEDTRQSGAGSSSETDEEGQTQVSTADEEECDAGRRVTDRGSAVGAGGGKWSRGGVDARRSRAVGVDEKLRRSLRKSRRHLHGCAGAAACEAESDGMADGGQEEECAAEIPASVVCWLAGGDEANSSGARAGGDCSGYTGAGGEAQAECDARFDKTGATVVDTRCAGEVGNVQRRDNGSLDSTGLHSKLSQRPKQQSAEGQAGVLQLQEVQGSVQETTALSGDREGGQVQGDRQAGRSSATGCRGVRAGMGVRAARWTVTVDEADAEDCEMEGEFGLLQAVECEGEETGHAVAENDGVLGEAQGFEADGNWQGIQVSGFVQVSQAGGREDGACGANRGNDGSDEEDRAEQGATEVQVSAGVGEDDAEVATGGSVRRVGCSFDEVMQAAIQAERQVFEDACADAGEDVEAVMAKNAASAEIAAVQESAAGAGAEAAAVGNESAVDELLVRVQQLEPELAAFAAEIAEAGDEAGGDTEEEELDLWDDSSEQEEYSDEDDGGLAGDGEEAADGDAGSGGNAGDDGGDESDEPADVDDSEEEVDCEDEDEECEDCGVEGLEVVETLQGGWLVTVGLEAALQQAQRWYDTWSEEVHRSRRRAGKVLAELPQAMSGPGAVWRTGVRARQMLWRVRSSWEGLGTVEADWVVMLQRMGDLEGLIPWETQWQLQAKGKVAVAVAGSKLFACEDGGGLATNGSGGKDSNGIEGAQSEDAGGHAEAPMAPSGLEQLRQRGLSAAVWVGGRRRTVREKSRIGGQEEVDSAHLEHGARRKVGGVRMASGDLDDGVLRNVQVAADEKRTVDCIENDKAPKAPIAGKKKKRSTDEDENEQGATKYLKYGKGIG